MRVQKQFHPNPDCASVHIDKVVTEEMIAMFESRNKSLTSPEKKAPEFIDKMFDIPGVVSVSCHKYSVTITKGKVFRWDEVLPQVVEVLKSNFEPEGEITELPKIVKVGRMLNPHSLFGLFGGLDSEGSCFDEEDPCVSSDPSDVAGEDSLTSTSEEGGTEGASVSGASGDDEHDGEFSKL